MSIKVFEDIINATKEEFPIVKDWEWSNCKNGVMEIRTHKEEIYCKNTSEMIKIMLREILILDRKKHNLPRIELQPLPIVDLKPDFDTFSTINYYEGDGEKPYWKICKYQENSTAYTMIVCIGENELIKSIEDFNNRAAMLFGFYLKEPEGAEKWEEMTGYGYNR